MQLGYLQQQLEHLYEIETGYDVEAFVITDAGLAAVLEGNPTARDIPEKLLIQDTEAGLELSLYLHRLVVEQLAEEDPFRALHRGNLSAFWTALEGVSHFVYLAWNALHERPVSLLEMELQAEVDKFVLAGAIFARQLGGIPEDLHAVLFQRFRYDPQLEPEERRRYAIANHHAQRYCSMLHKRFLQRCAGQHLTRELRRFYRLWHRRKIEWIDCVCHA